jgi:hypothetical protein
VEDIGGKIQGMLHSLNVQLSGRLVFSRIPVDILYRTKMRVIHMGAWSRLC